MHPQLSIAVLGIPAMLVAGLASSAHCALMCGLLHAGATRGGSAWPMQAGRLTAYALLGALAGWAGGWLLRLGSWVPAAEALRIAALPLLLAALLWRPLRARPAAACCEPSRRLERPRGLAGFAAGLAAGLTPCVLLYAAAGYAAMSASPAQGALLLFAFGLGTVPAVQAGAWAWARLSAVSAPVLVRRTAIAVAIGSAVLMAAASLVQGGNALWWCLPS